MVTVTEIIKDTKSRSKKVKVLFDDGQSLQLYYGDLRTFGIRCEEEVSQKTMDALFETLYKRGLSYCYHLIGKRDYTEFEIENKLTKSGYPKTICSRIIQQLYKMRLLNDDEYAVKFINTYINDKGVKWIENKLYLKGIKDCSDYLAQSDVRLQFDASKKSASKWLRLHPKESSNSPKLRQFLYRKGFESDVINEVLTEISENI